MKKNKGTSAFFKMVVLGFAVYSIYTVLSLQIQIQKKQDEYALLKTNIEAQELKNAEIEAIIENSDDPEYIAKIARDKLGYISPGEKVFVNITN